LLLEGLLYEIFQAHRKQQRACISCLALICPLLGGETFGIIGLACEISRYQMITSLGSGFVMNFRGVNFLSVLRMLTNKREGEV
jgi:hypothetical protein